VGNACVADDVLYFSTNHGVYALETVTGNELWLSKTNGILISSPLVYGGLCYVGSNGFMNALDCATGRKKWRYAVPGEVSSAALYNNLLIFRADAQVYAIDAMSGKELRWQANAENNTLSALCPVVVGDKVIFAGPNKTLCAVEATTGKSIWETSLKTQILLPLASAQGIVVVKAQGKEDRYGYAPWFLYAIDVEKGLLLWTYKSESASQNSYNMSALVIADGIIYFLGNEDGKKRDVTTITSLYAFELKTGTLKFMTDYNEKYVSELGFAGIYSFNEKSTPVIHDGIIYLQTDKGLSAWRD
jgi:outer membrane protein assembly factor BamB